MMRLLVLSIALLLVGCSSSEKFLSNSISQAERKFQEHIGFILFDPVKNETLFEHQSDRYFTPASNTKVLTFYTSLHILGDSIPALKYVTKDDSLIFWGTGDPSLLNPNVYADSSVIQFLRAKGERYNLYLMETPIPIEPFGKGWAWDDYNDYYQPERTALPLYGNVVTFKTSGASFKTSPSYFSDLVIQGPSSSKAKIVRHPFENAFTFYPSSTKGEYQVPYKTSTPITAILLQEIVKKKITIIPYRPIAERKVLYNTRADSVYAVFMKESDNFIAEQLLLVCQSTLTDTLNTTSMINFVQQNYFSNFQDNIVWVDGSGLSRYNLITPRTMVQVWAELYAKIPEHKLFPLLVIGGEPGTLKNYFVASNPYVFGKTGTLSNNHSLSGFIRTKNNRILIFSFMNGNFIVSTTQVRKEMESILNYVYETY
jgi:D-alanyl-D-alanine carboxypeptidase/D-alanyl-D-alanine-endopeptidase (penicillin-binding protein 4)